MRVSILAIFIGFASTTSLAQYAQAQMVYYLEKDLGVVGFQHRCKYSNGKIYAVNSTELCPLSMKEEGYLPQGNRTTGFKAGEYQDGLTKVCVYNVLGNKRAIRIGSVELCPLTYDF